MEPMEPAPTMPMRCDVLSIVPDTILCICCSLSKRIQIDKIARETNESLMLFLKAGLA